MPSRQAQATIHMGDWDAMSRLEPSQKWMEFVVHNIFDKHLWDTPYSDLYTDDLSLLLPDGTEVNGGKAAWAAVAQLFGMMTKQHTEPFYLVTTETEYGWETVGLANIFGNLPGDMAAGEVTYRSEMGTDWDVKMPGGFRFQYRKVAGAKHDGILLQMVQIFTDSAPVLKKLLARGILKPNDLATMI